MSIQPVAGMHLWLRCRKSCINHEHLRHHEGWWTYMPSSVRSNKSVARSLWITLAHCSNVVRAASSWADRPSSWRLSEAWYCWNGPDSDDFIDCADRGGDGALNGFPGTILRLRMWTEIENSKHSQETRSLIWERYVDKSDLKESRALDSSVNHTAQMREWQRPSRMPDNAAFSPASNGDSLTSVWIDVRRDQISETLERLVNQLLDASRQDLADLWNQSWRTWLNWVCEYIKDDDVRSMYGLYSWRLAGSREKCADDEELVRMAFVDGRRSGESSGRDACWEDVSSLIKWRTEDMRESFLSDGIWNICREIWTVSMIAIKAFWLACCISFGRYCLDDDPEP